MRAITFRLGRLLPGGVKAPGKILDRVYQKKESFHIAEYPLNVLKALYKGFPTNSNTQHKGRDRLPVRR